MENNKNFIWADTLRVFTTFFVILYHICCIYLDQYGKIPNKTWWFFCFCNTIVMCSVPVFVMLSGALILQKEYLLTDFLKKRFSRILLPFIFWSAVYIAFSISNETSTGKYMSLYDVVLWSFDKLKFGAEYHLWFVYMIIGLYLFVPIISKWIKNTNENEIVYYLLIWGFWMLMEQPIMSYFKIDFHLIHFSGYLGYFILGYYLSIKDFNLNRFAINTISALMILLGSTFAAFGIYQSVLSTSKANLYFQSNLNFHVLLIGSGLFLLYRFNPIKNKKIIKIISFFSKYSFGIYLVHILTFKSFDTITFYFSYYIIDLDIIYRVPLLAIYSFLISTLMIYLVNKLPFGKYISG